MAEISMITFYRPPTGWRDRLRSYRLVIDGSVRAKIRPGETVRVPVSPGPHRVRATIDGTGSPALIVPTTEGSESRLRVEPNGSSFSALWQILDSTTYLRLTYEGVAALPAAPATPAPG